MRIFFTSDTHFAHANIIRYCGRPFSNVDEMDNHMITRWNHVVGRDDIVYHLGDFAFNNHKWYLSQLKGTIKFVRGNHDKNPVALGMPPHIRDIKIEDHFVTLCHYAMRVWNKSHFNAFLLFGHSHGCLKNEWGKSMDVGVDSNNFTPIVWEEIVEVMKTKPDNFNWVKRLRGYNKEEFEREK